MPHLHHMAVNRQAQHKERRRLFVFAIVAEVLFTLVNAVQFPRVLVSRCFLIILLWMQTFLCWYGPAFNYKCQETYIRHCCCEPRLLCELKNVDIYIFRLGYSGGSTGGGSAPPVAPGWNLAPPLTISPQFSDVLSKIVLHSTLQCRCSFFIACW